jgi:hypothetical protein
MFISAAQANIDKNEIEIISRYLLKIAPKIHRHSERCSDEKSQHKSNRSFASLRMAVYQRRQYQFIMELSTDIKIKNSVVIIGL